MRRGRRRKIEVPTGDTPQFELGDTAEDIERRRREREEREVRERREKEERDRQREREMEEEERREKRARTDTDTDAESTQSRQKKGQKTILLSDSDEEAIVEFIKPHKQLYDKTNKSFKDKQKKERLWEEVAATRNLPAKTVKKWFETQCTRYGKLTQTKSGQGAEKNTEQQTWLKDSFSFLRGHIRRKGVSKSSAFK